MARSPGMSQALARSPGLVVSTVLTCMVGALLPPLPGLTLFVSGLALTAVLCSSGLERPAVQLLGRAQVLSEVETAALASDSTPVPEGSRPAYGRALRQRR
jgi:hypothetical protein